MKIILLSRFCHKKGSRPISPYRFWMTLLPVLALVLGGAIWGGYEWGLHAQSQAVAKEDATDVVRDLLQQQRQALEETRGRTQEHLDALALRLGQMQSDILRINALGERLVELGELDEEEFNFQEVPARGGIDARENAQSITSSELLNEMDSLARVLDDREHKLNLMEDLIRNTQLLDELLPAGRPVEKGWISSRYGYRNDPFTGKRAFHHGVDVAGKWDSNIVAVASGVVIWAGEKNGYGLLVEIKHANGYSTRYGHNNKILVEVGDLVTQGQTVALMGSSGRSTGPHVHFEIARHGQTLNPAKYLRAKR